MKWEIVIGLETHAQLSTVSKIFSGSSTAFGAAPNSQASAVDIALPGVLPVMNKGAVERAIRFGLAINAQLNRRSIFARKNYFYPDLPKGYQISQYELPIVGNGALNVVVGDAEKTIRITRAHLEEDAGKSLHEDSLRALGGASLNGKSGIDLNRAGTPLLEIVSEPDMRSAQEAVAYAKTLHALVRWIGICDGNMQEGSFRCDANVSVRRVGEEKFGTRCEIKNLNSFRFLEQAIEYEAQRQIELIEDGGTVVQETRLFDPDKGETRTMRSKEDAMDYRYFPDPDLPPLVVSEAWIDAVKKTMPALPAEKYRALIAAGIAPATATVLTENLATALYFEAASADANAEVARQIANWIAGAVNAGLNEAGVLIENSPVSAVQLRGLVERIVDGTISNRIAKEVFDALWNGVGKDADAVIEAKGLKQISDIGAIEKIVDEVLAKNPKSVEEYRAGKEKAFNALVGQVMKAMQGKANPAQVNALLKKKLDG